MQRLDSRALASCARHIDLQAGPQLAGAPLRLVQVVIKFAPPLMLLGLRLTELRLCPAEPFEERRRRLGRAPTGFGGITLRAGGCEQAGRCKRHRPLQHPHRLAVGVPELPELGVVLHLTLLSIVTTAPCLAVAIIAVTCITAVMCRIACILSAFGIPMVL